MDTTQVLIIIGLTIAAVLLIVLLVAVRRRKARTFNALTPEERELHYAKRDHDKRVSQLKSELKSHEKVSKKRTKQAEDRLKDAMKIGTNQLDSLKSHSGAVSLTGLALTTPRGEHAITPQTTATVEVSGTAPATPDDPDTRRSVLALSDASFDEKYEYDASDETAVRALAAKITSAAAHVEVLQKQREDAVLSAENEVAEANANATIEANNAQARFDAASQESLAKVRAAEDAVRLRGINPTE